MLYCILVYKKGTSVKFHDLVVTSHKTSQCICLHVTKIYTWKLSVFYSATFPKAVNKSDKSDVKIEDLTSIAKIQRKQVCVCVCMHIKETTCMYALTHVHTQSNIISDNFSAAVIMN